MCSDLIVTFNLKCKSNKEKKPAFKRMAPTFTQKLLEFASVTHFIKDIYSLLITYYITIFNIVLQVSFTNI